MDAKTAGLLAIDLERKGQIDLLVWSSRGIAALSAGRGACQRIRAWAI